MPPLSFHSKIWFNHSFVFLNWLLFYWLIVFIYWFISLRKSDCSALISVLLTPCLFSVDTILSGPSVNKCGWLWVRSCGKVWTLWRSCLPFFYFYSSQPLSLFPCFIQFFTRLVPSPSSSSSSVSYQLLSWLLFAFYLTLLYFSIMTKSYFLFGLRVFILAKPCQCSCKPCHLLFHTLTIRLTALKNVECKIGWPVGLFERGWCCFSIFLFFFFLLSFFSPLFSSSSSSLPHLLLTAVASHCQGWEPEATHCQERPSKYLFIYQPNTFSFPHKYILISTQIHLCFNTNLKIETLMKNVGCLWWCCSLLWAKIISFHLPTKYILSFPHKYISVSTQISKSIKLQEEQTYF